MLVGTNRLSGRPGPLSGIIASSDLRQMSFDALIATVEAAGPNADRTGIVELYRRWITGQGPGVPHLYAAWFNLGTELTRSGEKAHAMLAYRNALSLQPTFAPAAINLALLLRSDYLGNETIAVLRGALQPDEARTELINNRARLLEKCGRLLEAEREFQKSLLIWPTQPNVIQHWLHVRQKQCAWPILSDTVPGLSRESLVLHAGPLSGLALFEEAFDQGMRAAEEVLAGLGRGVASIL